MEKLTRGIVSGTLATLPMTWTMVRLRRKEPRERFKSLPPRLITLRLAHKLGLGKRLDRKEKRGLIRLSHFGYGALMGGLFALLPERGRGRSHGRLTGPMFGLAVWAISYLGLMPALSLHRRATRDPASRNRLMIISHLVWGFFLGLAFRLTGRMPGSRWA